MMQLNVINKIQMFKRKGYLSNRNKSIQIFFFIYYIMMQLITINKDKNVDYAYFIFLISLLIMIIITTKYNLYRIEGIGREL